MRLIQLALFALLLGCTSPEWEEECSTIEHPPAIGLESDAQLVEKYRVNSVLKLPEHKVLVFRECDADYKVVFYKRGSAGFVPDGSEFILLSFERPILNGDPKSTVWTRHVESGERFYFKVEPHGIELVPEDGEWRELSRGLEAHDDGAEPERQE